MLRSLMTAVTGVRAHQTMLDVTGNNIANANTTGFKKDNTIFQDLMYQNQKLASAPADGRGGINPAQIGLGVSVGAIETIFTQGAANYTGNPSDMMIQGNGFFVYSNGTGNNLYSRAGACVRDANNDLVQSGTGYKVQGYAMEEDPLQPGTYVKSSDLGNITIPLGKKLEPKATTEIKFQCNLDSRSDAYLPYGFADLPYNAHCGWTGNPAGTAIIEMGGKNYHLALETNFKSATLKVGNGNSASTVDRWVEGSAYATTAATVRTGVGEDYFRVKIGLSGNDAKDTKEGSATWVPLDMVGIDKTTGKPILAVDTENAVYASKAYKLGDLGTDGKPLSQDQINAKNAQRTVLGFINAYELPGGEMVVPEYDPATGVLKLKEAIKATTGRGEFYLELGDSAAKKTVSTAATLGPSQGTYYYGGKTLFEYNVVSNMNYIATTIKTDMLAIPIGETKTAAVPVEYTLLAEFDETAQETGSSLSKRESNMTLWIGSSNDIKAKIDAKVYFKVDGSFDHVEYDEKAEEVFKEVGLKPYDYTLSEDANNANGANFRIGTGNGGSSLVIQQGVMTTEKKADNTPVLKTAAWESVKSINQGGYHQTKQTIYDCNGNPYTLEVNFKKITENRWRWEAFLLDKDGNAVSTGPTCDDGSTSTSTANTTLVPQPSSGEIEFCGCGPICNVITDGSADTSLEAEIEIPFSLMGMTNEKVKLNMGGDGDKMYGVTQFASETTTKAVYQNGYPMGIMEDYSIGTDGTITGNYSNGQRIPLYRVALATFANEQGLEKVGNTMFRATINSGNASIDAAGSNGKGTILSQNTEMSNVDLTEEFTHLIIAQRGFQANTRVITTSDQILEEVVNLKR